jgi:hypothetical protein
MLQKAMDVAVLTSVSLVYELAVVLLKHVRRPAWR